MARMSNYIDIFRRLMRGETIGAHNGPARQFSKLRLMSDSNDDKVPIMGVGIGEKIIDWSASLISDEWLAVSAKGSAG